LARLSQWTIIYAADFYPDNPMLLFTNTSVVRKGFSLKVAIFLKKNYTLFVQAL